MSVYNIYIYFIIIEPTSIILSRYYRVIRTTNKRRYVRIFYAVIAARLVILNHCHLCLIDNFFFLELKLKKKKKKYINRNSEPIEFPT